jgi:hypothetical protein
MRLLTRQPSVVASRTVGRSVWQGIFKRYPGGKMGKYALVVALLVGLSDLAFARDDGRYASDTLKHWFDNLTSSKRQLLLVRRRPFDQ